MTPALHARLSESARAAQQSLNEYCVRALARDTGAVTGGPLNEVVAKVLAQLGSAVVGIAVFGSYARGEARESSDVDVLVVTSSQTRISRALYAAWDQDRKYVGPHLVEPHFVRMPEPDERITGLWAEVALEGIVIFDPDFVLGRQLTRVRRAILDGLLVRRSAHGLSYWTAA